MNMFQLMKKYAQEAPTSRVEEYPSLTHQQLWPNQEKETDASHYLSPESRELLHLEHLEILNFYYKTNHESTQFKDKVHNYKQYQALMKQRNNELVL